MTKLNMKQIVGSWLAATLLIAGNTYASIWQSDNTANRSIDSGHAIFISDSSELRRMQDQIPGELSGQSLEIELPMPDGSLALYRIYESSIMQPGLAAKFPEIKSYVVHGVDHPGSTGRVDISPKGFRGMIYTPYGRVFIDPERSASTRYRSRTSKGHVHQDGRQCGVYNLEANKQSPLRNFNQNLVTPARVSGSITSYRLAVSATPEYVAAVSSGSPSLSQAMAEINTAFNRVNLFYERDLGIKLFLVTDNDKLIDVQGNANFTNDVGITLLDENQDWIDSKIGSDSYDIGHIFSTGGGGVAQLQSVCSSSKARGVTGLSNPNDLMSDLFYVDFVSHEIGHQFGANHTFNGSTDSCGAQRNSSTAFEPGSGSTIMAYAGICGGENLQSASEATFHAGTIAEINAFVTDANTGGSCAAILATSPTNTDPASANAGSDQTIPMGTPFVLSGSANDADGDELSYQWDQLDLGAVATTSANFNFDQGNNPLFRSYEPQTSAERHFPSLGNQLDITAVKGEIVPTTSRNLNFRFTTRDCKSGQTTDDVRLTVDSSSGPFRVTSHTVQAIFPATSNPMVTWAVANTTNPATVNCANVDIDLLTFNGTKSTFAVTNLLSSTPNDGSETVTISDSSASIARFRVSCSDNVFYDISDADLTLTGAGTFATTGNSTALSSAAICGATNVDGTPPGIDGSSGSGGGGSPHPLWLLVLAVIVGVSRTSGQVVVRAYTRS